MRCSDYNRMVRRVANMTGVRLSPNCLRDLREQAMDTGGSVDSGLRVASGRGGQPGGGSSRAAAAAGGVPESERRRMENPSVGRSNSEMVFTIADIAALVPRVKFLDVLDRAQGLMFKREADELLARNGGKYTHACLRLLTQSDARLSAALRIRAAAVSSDNDLANTLLRVKVRRVEAMCELGVEMDADDILDTQVFSTLNMVAAWEEDEGDSGRDAAGGRTEDSSASSATQGSLVHEVALRIATTLSFRLELHAFTARMVRQRLFPLLGRRENSLVAGRFRASDRNRGHDGSDDGKRGHHARQDATRAAIVETLLAANMHLDTFRGLVR